MTLEPVRVLELSLYGDRVGFLAGYQGGHNILVFDDTFALDPSRPTLTLTTQVGFPKADELLAAPWIRRQRLHPVLSNLLPEGALRDWLAQRLKVHPDHEFPLMAALGRDLPGALVATPMSAERVPDWALAHRDSVASMVEDVETLQGFFSKAGVGVNLRPLILVKDWVRRAFRLLFAVCAAVWNRRPLPFDLPHEVSASSEPRGQQLRTRPTRLPGYCLRCFVIR